MKRVILIPDSFKGTMESAEICAIMAEQIHRHFPRAETVSIPVADGGEGSVDAFLQAMGGEKVRCRTQNPFGEELDSFYGLVDQGQTAVIEMAASAGLPLVEDRLDPLRASTYGVGQLMLDAARRGVKKLIMGLGGSATNDGGCGAACAAGVRFLDAAGNTFVPTGGTLKDIARIDMTGLDKSLQDMEIVTMCDIDNPLYGPTGAAHVFGPQKGATPAVAEELDKGLLHLCQVMQRDTGKDVSALPGGGAAGGMGAGMAVFFDSALQMGIETVLDTVRFDRLLQGADMVFTGEGKIDGQSLRGKVVIGVARRARQANVPVVAIVGDIGDHVEPAYDEGVSAIFSINRVAVEYRQARPRAKSDLALTMDNLMRFLSRMEMA
ncbi:glycerate kinase [Ruminococcaceae bacterium OttesenSCG-928-L11]|nr:glycerate kinase [Ruminococcaceae bacterium OttesenSCG-928-L11]